MNTAAIAINKHNIEIVREQAEHEGEASYIQVSVHSVRDLRRKQGWLKIQLAKMNINTAGGNQPLTTPTNIEIGY